MSLQNKNKDFQIRSTKNRIHGATPKFENLLFISSLHTFIYLFVTSLPHAQHAAYVFVKNKLK